MAIRRIFGPDSDSSRIRQKSGGFLWIPDSSNTLKEFFLKIKKISAAYDLKINVLGVLYNSLPRIEPDFKRYYI